MIRLRQIKVNIEENQTKSLLKKISKLLRIESSKIKNYTLIKKSLDARKKDELFKERHAERHKGNLGKGGDDIHYKHMKNVDKIL